MSRLSHGTSVSTETPAQIRITITTTTTTTTTLSHPVYPNENLALLHAKINSEIRRETPSKYVNDLHVCQTLIDL